MDEDAVKRLASDVKKLMEGEVGKIVRKRVKEFKEMGRKPGRELFKELCFCILTANFSAEKGIIIQRKIGDEFLTLPEGELARRLRKLGHRYPEARARYIVEARRYKGSLRRVIEELGEPRRIRDWLARNVKGVGYKEASHFLRNMGFLDLAILDFHILNILHRYGLIQRPKTLTPRRYVEIEETLRRVAELLGITLGELDLYLWYMETGKVLK